MVTIERLAIAGVGIAAAIAAAALVRRDARRVGVSRPQAWAVLVAGSVGIGLGLYLFVPTVPVPGLLILVLFGPVFYLFERDDTRHGDEPAEPGALPDQPGTDGSGNEPPESTAGPEHGEES